jgi:hypothetical protein
VTVRRNPDGRQQPRAMDEQRLSVAGDVFHSPEQETGMRCLRIEGVGGHAGGAGPHLKMRCSWR